jgi:hypothetical protein
MTAVPIPVHFDLDPRLWTERELTAAAAGILCGRYPADASAFAISDELDRRRGLSAHERIPPQKPQHRVALAAGCHANGPPRSRGRSDTRCLHARGSSNLVTVHSSASFGSISRPRCLSEPWGGGGPAYSRRSIGSGTALLTGSICRR